MKKKVVTLSLLTIVMCVSLIVGATLALFGSESKKNIAITSANVDVKASIDEFTTYSMGVPTSEIVGRKNGVFENGGTASTDENGNLILNKVSPGDSVQVQVGLQNDSNIDIQYRVRVTCLEGEDLFGQLNISFDMNRQFWTEVPAEEAIEPVAVTIEFPYTEGYQEYQGLSTEIAFIVEAVQGNADTENDEITVAATGTPEENGAALVQALENVSDGGTIYVSAGEIELPQETYNSSINGDLTYGLLVNKSVTLKGAKAGIPADDPSRGTNETIIGGSVSGYNSGATMFAQYDIDVVIDGFTFESGAWDTIGCDDPGVRNATIVNNVFKVDEGAQNATPVKLKLESGTISDNKFIGTNCGYGVRIIDVDRRPISWPEGSVPASFTIDIDVTNNDFSELSINPALVEERGIVHISTNSNDTGTITVADNIFSESSKFAIYNASGNNAVSIISDKNVGVTDSNVYGEVEILNRYIADGFIYNGTEKVYEIFNADGLVYFAQSVNGGNSYTNQTIVLTDDIDLAGIEWEPIDAWKGELSNAVIDGNGNTVYNLTIHGEGQGRLGFIGENTSTMTIKDLTFSGAEITNSGSFSAVVIGYQYGAVTLTNVDVTDSKVFGRESTDDVKDIRIGGLVGFSILNDGAKLYLTNCDVTGSEFYGYHNVAGLVGTLYDCWGDVNASYGNGAYVPKEAWSMTSCNVTDCRFTIDGPSANYVNGFAVDSAYVKTFDEATAAFEELGNTQSGNTFTYTAGLLNMGNDTYHLLNADGLVSLSSNVNGGNSYEGKTIVLMDDIDLTDIEWTPIGSNVDGYCFGGTFEGNNHIISNMSVTAPTTVYGGQTTGWEDYKNSYSYAGFFGVVTGTVRKLNFVNCSVNVSDETFVHENGEPWRGDVYAGIAVGVNFGEVENVSVKDSSVAAKAWLISSAGGVVGENIATDMTASGYPLYVGTISGCNVENVEVSAVSEGWTANAGGIVGSSGDRLYIPTTAYVSNCTVKHSEISSSVTGATTADKIDWPAETTYFGRTCCGGIGGLAVNTASAANNTVEENTLETYSYASGESIIFEGETWGYGA